MFFFPPNIWSEINQFLSLTAMILWRLFRAVCPHSSVFNYYKQTLNILNCPFKLEWIIKALSTERKKKKLRKVTFLFCFFNINLPHPSLLRPFFPARLMNPNTADPRPSRAPCVFIKMPGHRGPITQRWRSTPVACLMRVKERARLN